MNKIIIYTTSWCPYCTRAKALLDSKKVEYEEKDIELEPGAREAMQLKSGKNTVPQVWVGNNYLGGCDELEGLDKRGDLDVFLDTSRPEGGTPHKPAKMPNAAAKPKAEAKPEAEPAPKAED